MKIRELLHRRSGDIFRIKPSASIEHAANSMTENNIGALFVEDGTDNIVGVISERDIVAGISERGANLLDATVSDLMTRDLVRCEPDTSVNEAMGMMTDRRVRHLPVFEDNKLIGLVSIGDLVKYRIMEVQSEADAMRAYIAS